MIELHKSHIGNLTRPSSPCETLVFKWFLYVEDRMIKMHPSSTLDDIQ